MHPPDSSNEGEILEVCLAGQDLTELCLVEYGSFIRRIDLSYNVLISLRGLHICADTLEELILDNNLLERVDFRAEFPKLHTLSLNKNRITDIDILLQELSGRVKNLRHLSLLGNPVCPDQLTNDLVEEKDYQIYRCHVLFHLKNVRFLDYRPVPPAELKESRKLIYRKVQIVQSFTPLVSRSSSLIAIHTRRSSTSTSGSGSNSPRNSHDHGPVPVTNGNGHGSGGLRRASTSYLETRRGSTTHNANRNNENPNDSDLSGTEIGPDFRDDGPGRTTKGRTGRRRFRYVGKNSEGNRFIQDGDL